jgi:tetratricopeptide (TPR) repeat protein
MWLQEGEQQIAAQNAAGAAASFEKVLSKYPGQPRAEYGLAVALVLQGQGGKAKEVFERVVATVRQAQGAAAPPLSQGDARILAWSHVYLGRIHDLQGNRELALSEYRAALAVEGAPETARIAAQHGIEKEFEPPRSSREAGQQRP